MCVCVCVWCPKVFFLKTFILKVIFTKRLYLHYLVTSIISEDVFNGSKIFCILKQQSERQIEYPQKSIGSPFVKLTMFTLQQRYKLNWRSEISSFPIFRTIYIHVLTHSNFHGLIDKKKTLSLNLKQCSLDIIYSDLIYQNAFHPI